MEANQVSLNSLNLTEYNQAHFHYDFCNPCTYKMSDLRSCKKHLKLIFHLYLYPRAYEGNTYHNRHIKIPTQPLSSDLMILFPRNVCYLTYGDNKAEVRKKKLRVNRHSKSYYLKLKNDKKINTIFYLISYFFQQ